MLSVPFELTILFNDPVADPREAVFKDDVADPDGLKRLVNPEVIRAIAEDDADDTWADKLPRSLEEVDP